MSPREIMAVQYLYQFAPGANFLQLFCPIVGVKQQIIVIGSKVYFMSLGFIISPNTLTTQGKIMEKQPEQRSGKHQSEIIITIIIIINAMLPIFISKTSN